MPSDALTSSRDMPAAMISMGMVPGCLLGRSSSDDELLLLLELLEEEEEEDEDDDEEPWKRYIGVILGQLGRSNSGANLY